MAIPFIPGIPDITKILSTFFNIPPSYFEFPNIIFYFIIPFIAAIYFWYVVLNYKIRIFRRNKFVNAALGFFIAFFNVAAVAIFPPWLTVPIFVSFATILAGHHWTKKRVALAFILFVFLWLIYPW